MKKTPRGRLQREALVAAFTRLGGICRPTPKDGFVNVFGPTGAATDRGAALVIVQNNGSVSFRNEALASRMGAKLRPRAINLSSGDEPGHYGHALWNLEAGAIRERSGGSEAVARAIVQAFGDVGIGW